MEQIAEISMGVGGFGVDGDGAAISRFGLFEPALGPVDVADVRVRRTGRRVESRRLLEVLERLIQAATLTKQAAEQIVRVGVIRSQFERAAVSARCRFQIAGLMLLEAMAYSIDDLGVIFQGRGI